jgi:hypothetical protein
LCFSALGKNAGVFEAMREPLLVRKTRYRWVFDHALHFEQDRPNSQDVVVESSFSWQRAKRKKQREALGAETSIPELLSIAHPRAVQQERVFRFARTLRPRFGANASSKHVEGIQSQVLCFRMLLEKMPVYSKPYERLGMDAKRGTAFRRRSDTPAKLTKKFLDTVPN